ncbi:glycosyl hydrolase family 18 protein [Pullulanibacillus sp. KACC 23026]|uniref:glycosyl hydrolase family 18 protein n=1 Tax=Pullulanibacillus sp. KACC 23026 TaxID=3028315 RepID=UPI0023B0C057|nr:glycosyl hydrolase family 18 protein [Pullulanibacillus sp. KACC 23026]WEG13503.1 glycosyl hydrolase family 18 protein [Pullulanibacillus sp. KACC 23026]
MSFLIGIGLFSFGSHRSFAQTQTPISFAYLYGRPPSSFEASINRTNGTFNRVSPTYFGVNADGSLDLTSIDTQFINDMHQKSIKVIPRLTADWNKKLGEKALANREVLAAQIAKAVNKYHLDGVNVDLEDLGPSDKQALTQLTALLKQKLGKKEVSVAVAANPAGWTAGWQGSYDDRALAKVSDYIILMAYDESYAGSAPGPVAGLPFVTKSIDYALNQGVPKDKLVLGIPLYGRIWNTDMSVSGSSVPLYEVNTIMAKFHPSLTYSQSQQTPVATFAVGNNSHFRLNSWSDPLPVGVYTLYYENHDSISSKLNAVTANDLGGSAVWSIGQDDPALWTFYKAALNPIQGIH